MCSDNLRGIILGAVALICLTSLELYALSIGINGHLYMVVVMAVSLIAGVELQPMIREQLKKIKPK